MPFVSSADVVTHHSSDDKIGSKSETLIGPGGKSELDHGHTRKYWRGWVYPMVNPVNSNLLSVSGFPASLELDQMNSTAPLGGISEAVV